jgi:inosose dehydratase
MTRRDFLAAGAAGAAGVVFAPSLLASEMSPRRAADIAVGITIDTRPDWAGAGNFLRAMDESSAVGYRMIEVFPNQLGDLFRDAPRFRDEMARRNLGLVTVSGGGNFVDPAQRATAIENNLEICRFIRECGGRHLKINIGGGRATTSQTQAPEVYREMAIGFNEQGKRISDMGMKFGIHAHGAHGNYGAFGSRPDVDAIMELTDPEHVYLILDTGWISMAGMDPLQLTRDYTDRIIEYHLKDVAPENRGGAPLPEADSTSPRHDPEAEYPGIDPRTFPSSIQFRDRQFFELGRGGVDFPGIYGYLNQANWQGWFTVELDSTVTTSKASSTVSKQYLEQVLGLSVETPGKRPGWST